MIKFIKKLIKGYFILSIICTFIMVSNEKRNEIQSFKETVITKIKESSFNSIAEKNPQKNIKIPSSKFQKVSIVRVVDGDTIIVDVRADNCEKTEHQLKVRLIGIDTPESVAPDEYLDKTGKENTQEGLNASEFTKSVLNYKTYLYLEKDNSDTDKYGRALRYVWLEIPQKRTDMEEIKTEMLQGILLDNKIAIPVEYEPDTKYSDEFKEIYK